MVIKDFQYYYEIFVKNIVASLSIIGISYVATFFLFMVTLCIPFVGWVLIPVIVWYWSVSLYIGAVMLVVGLVTDFYWVLSGDGTSEPPVTKYLNEQRRKTEDFLKKAQEYKPKF